MIITSKFLQCRCLYKHCLTLIVINTCITIQAIEVIPSKTGGVNRLNTNLRVMIISSKFLQCKCLSKNCLLFIIINTFNTIQAIEVVPSKASRANRLNTNLRVVIISSKLLKCSCISKDLFTVSINLSRLEVIPSKTSRINKLNTNLRVVIIYGKFLQCRYLCKHCLTLVIIITFINIQAIEVIPSETSGVNRLNTNLRVMVISNEFLQCSCLSKDLFMISINNFSRLEVITSKASGINRLNTNLRVVIIYSKFLQCRYLCKHCLTLIIINTFINIQAIEVVPSETRGVNRLNTNLRVK